MAEKQSEDRKAAHAPPTSGVPMYNSSNQRSTSKSLQREKTYEERLAAANSKEEEKLIE